MQSLPKQDPLFLLFDPVSAQRHLLVGKSQILQSESNPGASFHQELFNWMKGWIPGKGSAQINTGTELKLTVQNSKIKSDTKQKKWDIPNLQGTATEGFPLQMTFPVSSRGESVPQSGMPEARAAQTIAAFHNPGSGNVSGTVPLSPVTGNKPAGTRNGKAAMNQSFADFGIPGKGTGKQKGLNPPILNHSRGTDHKIPLVGISENPVNHKNPKESIVTLKTTPESMIAVLKSSLKEAVQNPPILKAGTDSSKREPLFNQPSARPIRNADMKPVMPQSRQSLKPAGPEQTTEAILSNRRVLGNTVRGQKNNGSKEGDLFLTSKLTAEARPGTIPLESKTLLHSSEAIPRKEFVEQISPILKRMILDGKSKVTLILHPKYLGPLQIEIQSAREYVETKFIVENQETKGLIDNSLPELKQILEKEGIRIQGFDVQIAQQFSLGAEQNNRFRKDQLQEESRQKSSSLKIESGQDEIDEKQKSGMRYFGYNSMEITV